MTVTPKGYTQLTNSSDFNGPEQIDAAELFLENLIGESIASTGNLPLTGNWPGRQIYVRSDSSVRVSDGTSQWRTISRDWNAFSAVWSGITFGSGASTLYSYQKLSSNELTARVGVKFGTSGFSMSDPNITPPVAIASWFSGSPAPIGTVIFSDVSAGAAGRWPGLAYQAGSTIRLVTAQSPTQTTSSTVPFTLGAGDEIHIELRYPV